MRLALLDTDTLGRFLTSRPSVKSVAQKAPSVKVLSERAAPMGAQDLAEHICHSPDSLRITALPSGVPKRILKLVNTMLAAAQEDAALANFDHLPSGPDRKTSSNWLRWLFALIIAIACLGVAVFKLFASEANVFVVIYSVLIPVFGTAAAVFLLSLISRRRNPPDDLVNHEVKYFCRHVTGLWFVAGPFERELSQTNDILAESTLVSEETDPALRGLQDSLDRLDEKSDLILSQLRTRDSFEKIQFWFVLIMSTALAIFGNFVSDAFLTLPPLLRAVLGGIIAAVSAFLLCIRLFKKRN
jgi:hypothetical protein